MAFLAVVREGLETALIFYSAAAGRWTRAAGRCSRSSAASLTAVVIGVLLYRSALRINLSKFFTWTGALLILVAAGILKYGVHDFQEAGVLPGLNNLAFDISGVLDPNSLVRRPARRHVQHHSGAHRARDGRLDRVRGAGALPVPPAAAAQADRRAQPRTPAGALAAERLEENLRCADLVSRRPRCC